MLKITLHTCFVLSEFECKICWNRITISFQWYITTQHKCVHSFTYPGSRINETNDVIKEINARVHRTIGATSVQNIDEK